MAVELTCFICGDIFVCTKEELIDSVGGAGQGVHSKFEIEGRQVILDIKIICETGDICAGCAAKIASRSAEQWAIDADEVNRTILPLIKDHRIEDNK